MRESHEVDCENAADCFDGWRMGKGCYPDDEASEMGGRPTQECHCMTVDERKEVNAEITRSLSVVASMLPAMSADPVLQDAIGLYQSVVVVGYDKDGDLLVASSKNLRSHEILWLIESFKLMLLNGEYNDG